MDPTSTPSPQIYPYPKTENNDKVEQQNQYIRPMQCRANDCHHIFRVSRRMLVRLSVYLLFQRALKIINGMIFFHS